MLKHKLVDFIIEFMEEVDKEISEMRLFVCIPRDVDEDIVCSPLLWQYKLTAIIAKRASQICGGIVSDSCKLLSPYLSSPSADRIYHSSISIRLHVTAVFYHTLNTRFKTYYCPAHSPLS